MAKRRKNNSSEQDIGLGVYTTYKGYEISRLPSDRGFQYKVIDRLMIVSPNLESEAEAKEYIDKNL
jgi:hypothetical protein